MRNSQWIFLLAFVGKFVGVVEQHSDHGHGTFTRRHLFAHGNHKVRAMRSRINHPSIQQFKTVTLNGGQQFVLIPRRMFLQNQHLFTHRRQLPPPKHSSSFSANAKPKQQFDPRTAKRRILTTNITVMPLQQKVTVSGKSASSSSSPAVSRRPSTLIKIPKPTAIPRINVPPHFPRPPTFIAHRPPLREVSSSVEGNFEEMAKKRDEFFKKQRVELQKMRKVMERERHRLEKGKERIVEEQRERQLMAERQHFLQQQARERERLRQLARERTFSVPTRRPLTTIKFTTTTVPTTPRPHHHRTTTAITTFLMPLPPAPEKPNEPGPPGQLPPSDQVIDELNSAHNFMDVAHRLRLRDQFGRKKKKVHA